MSLFLAACSGDMVAPRTDQPGGGFGPGSSGGSGTAASLLGVWQTVAIVEVPGDLQTWTTTWRFDADRTCRQTIVTESLAEGFPRTNERVCTWTVNGARVAISFVGAGTLTLDFSFAGLSPDRLVLDGFEYQRLS
ncbi:MAG: hypothetical protein ABIY46_04995 [Gemmatimonadales bacterium]